LNELTYYINLSKHIIF